jgi:cholesterol oxidase
MYVADGSTLPGPAGANPALTIAALADRAADGFTDVLTGTTREVSRR